MPVVEATLVKRYVDVVHEACGMPVWEIKDEIPLGTVFRVKLETRHRKRLLSPEHGIYYETEWVEDADHPDALLPTEILMRNGMAL